MGRAAPPLIGPGISPPSGPGCCREAVPGPPPRPARRGPIPPTGASLAPSAAVSFGCPPVLTSSPPGGDCGACLWASAFVCTALSRQHLPCAPPPRRPRWGLRGAQGCAVGALPPASGLPRAPPGRGHCPTLSLFRGRPSALLRISDLGAGRNMTRVKVTII